MKRDHNCLLENERYFDPANVTVKVGVGMLDISRDIPNHFVRRKCFDMTYWSINQSAKQLLCSYRGFSHSVNHILTASLDAGDEVCIIAAQGLMINRMYKIISQSVEYHKNNPDFFVIGHIMAREDRYPGLHRQLLIVNLKTWDALGRPEYMEQGYFWDRKPEYPNFVLSEETMSADYTPAWIVGAPGSKKYSVVEDGANWIALACEKGIKVDNLDFEMRESKAFLYPYEDTDLLEQAWKNLQDESLLDRLTNFTQRAWLRKLAYQEMIEKDRVYAYNTERLSGEGIRSPGPIDSIFSAAAGFKTIALLRNNGFHENTIVNYYDWCDSSLRFKKHLLETWDGIDFDKWLLKHDLEYNFSSTYRGNYSEFWKKELDKEFGSAEAFKQLWDRYSKLQHNFFIIDLVNEPEKLIAEINKQTGTKVLWTTNIWPTMMLHWNVDIDVIEQKYLEFEKLVPEDLVLYGQDYLANDLEQRIRMGKTETHPRLNTIWKKL
jgi:hypothetical protein